MHYSKITIALKCLPLMLLLLCGCQKDGLEMNPDELFIRFMPEDVPTKALPKEIFAEGDQVGIIQYLYVVENNENKSGTVPWNTKKVKIKPDPSFYNIKASYNAGTLNYGVAKAWSAVAEDQYTFFAYYPHNHLDDNVILSTESQEGAPYLNYKLPYISIADRPNKYDFSKVKDLMIAARYDHKKKYGTVKLAFDHLLSCVDFAVHNLNTSNQIRLLSLELSGTFCFDMQANMETKEVTQNNLKDYTFPFLSETRTFPSTLNGGAQSVGAKEKNFLLIVPRSKPSDWKVKATWDVLDSEGNILNQDKPYSFEKGIASNLTFVAGKKHTFTLNFLGDVCTITSQHTDWETPDNEDNDIEFE